jgi:hypothetical protein
MQSNNTSMATFYHKMVLSSIDPHTHQKRWTARIPCTLASTSAIVSATFDTKQEADEAVRHHFGSDSTRWNNGDEEQAFAEYVDEIVQRTIAREREVIDRRCEEVAALEEKVAFGGRHKETETRTNALIDKIKKLEEDLVAVRRLYAEECDVTAHLEDNCKFLNATLLVENQLCGLVIERTGTSIDDINAWQEGKRLSYVTWGEDDEDGFGQLDWFGEAADDAVGESCTNFH